MTIEYKLESRDYLDYQLYTASRSERIRKKRKRNRWLVPALYVLLGLLFLLVSRTLAPVFFIVFGCLWYFFYPDWERKRYKKHYQGFINENYAGRIQKLYSVTFSEDVIKLTDDGSESMIRTSEVQEINEIPRLIFIKFSSGQSLIVPKERIPDAAMLQTWLKELAIRLNVPYQYDDTWKWD